MSDEKSTVATEGGYLETRLRSFAVTRLHRDPETGEVWTEPESQRDQDLLDAADEMERLTEVGEVQAAKIEALARISRGAAISLEAADEEMERLRAIEQRARLQYEGGGVTRCDDPIIIARWILNG